jgi:hypothetical protein
MSLQGIPVDYRAEPDLVGELTPEKIFMFQTFCQSADVAQVELLEKAELERHLQLSLLSILRSARLGLNWCELPNHPILDYSVTVHAELKRMGYTIKHESDIHKQNVFSSDGTSSLVTSVKHRTVASWMLEENLSPKIAAEYSRRLEMESMALNTYVPRPTTLVDGNMQRGDVAWNSVIDCYLIEIQRILRRNFLCIFELQGGQHRFHEETSVSFGAAFGPDLEDIEHWLARAREIIGAFK